MKPYRVAKALCALSGEWQSFEELFSNGHMRGLEVKQLTGTLVAMRNRGLVASRRVHRDSGQELLQWRLHPELARWKK